MAHRHQEYTIPQGKEESTRSFLLNLQPPSRRWKFLVITGLILSAIEDLLAMEQQIPTSRDPSRTGQSERTRLETILLMEASMRRITIAKQARQPQQL